MKAFIHPKDAELLALKIADTLRKVARP